MTSSESTNSELHGELQAQLLESRTQWERRLESIQADRRRKSAALDPDFEEQAVQRENDETLDALDQRGRQELEAIDSALARLEAGTYGRCVRCGEAISPDRLRAQPTAQTCVPAAPKGAAA